MIAFTEDSDRLKTLSTSLHWLKAHPPLHLPSLTHQTYLLRRDALRPLRLLCDAAGLPLALPFVVTCGLREHWDPWEHEWVNDPWLFCVAQYSVCGQNRLY